MSEANSPSVVEHGVNRFFDAFEQTQRAVSIDNLYGQPVTHGETVIVPIASVSQIIGAGGGIGSGAKAEGQPREGVGGGGGGSISARPIAFAEIDAEGVKIHSIIDENRALAVSLAFAAWAVFWTARTLIKIFKPVTQ